MAIRHKYAVELEIDFHTDEFNVLDRYFIMLKEYDAQLRSLILIFEKDESFSAFELLEEEILHFRHASVFIEEFIRKIKREITLSWPRITRILINFLQITKRKIRLDLAKSKNK